MKDSHKKLQDMAIAWLHGRGCSIFAKEVPTKNGIADALGVRTPLDKKEAVYYIEAKASRGDLICQKQKLVYRRSIGDVAPVSCYYHTWNKGQYQEDPTNPKATCERCLELQAEARSSEIDFYYFIVAEGLTVEPTLYPEWGVINHKGDVVRKAKRIKRDLDTRHLIVAVAHVLVYKAYGKQYLGERIS